MRRIIVAAVTTVAVAGGAQAAGKVEVQYVAPEKYSDIGRGALERERTLASLTRAFRLLEPRLPDGQTLKVEVLDVNLAGELQPRHNAQEVRVMKNGADWPRVEMRWSLTDGARTLASGEEAVSDMSYLKRPPLPRLDTELPYEARMLQDWFEQKIAKR